MFAYKNPKQEKASKVTVQKKDTENPLVAPNLTGIPVSMKSRFENLSGLSFDDVRVHYNSEKPAQLQALAYTQGNQVYVGPGQEKHLGHELGHVIQQKQGRVEPTEQTSGFIINDNPNLEKEADSFADYATSEASEAYTSSYQSSVVQRMVSSVVVDQNTHYAGLGLNEKEKLRSVSQSVQRSCSTLFGINEVEIKLIPETFTGPNASILGPEQFNLIVIEDILETVEIRLDTRFIQNLSIGKIIGLINHELNVHTASTYGLTPEAREKEAREKDRPVDMTFPGDETNFFGDTITTNVKPSDDRQPDHVYATHVGVIPSKRADSYAKKTIDMAFGTDAKGSSSLLDHFLPDTSTTPADAARDAQIIDVISFYIFDIMRMQYENIFRISGDLRVPANLTNFKKTSDSLILLGLNQLKLMISSETSEPRIKKLNLLMPWITQHVQYYFETCIKADFEAATPSGHPIGGMLLINGIT